MRRTVLRAAALVLAAAASAAILTLQRAQERVPSELDAMIGEMLVIGFDGTAPGDPGVRDAARLLEAGRIGGVIVMDRNVRAPDQVRALTAALRAAPRERPALIAVDQEGGIVQRLAAAKGFGAYRSALDMGRDHDDLDAFGHYAAMAEELAGAGVNVNLGPVVDLKLNTDSHVIAGRERSYGADPERVTGFARAFIAAHRQAGVLTALKHFPGHGSSPADSHFRRVDLSQSWSVRELEPYRVLLAEGAVDMVMIGHLSHPEFSPDGLPASLSARAVQGWLRERLGFDGVVITDDMQMGAIARYHALEESLVQAVAAGNDILLFCNVHLDRGFAERAIGIIAGAVEDGRIARAQIEAAYARIGRLKTRLAAGRQAVGFGAAHAAR